MKVKIKIEGKINDTYTFSNQKREISWMNWRRSRKKWKLEELIK